MVSKAFSSRAVIVGVSLWWVVAANFSFFRHVLDVYPLSWSSAAELFSVAFVLFASSILILTLLTNR